jgi:hypothetical protein
MRLSLLSLCVASSLALAAGPSRPPKSVFIPGKDTTLFTGPRDELGYTDYAAALNRHLARGVKPKNNAAVYLWRAFGPAPEEALVPHEHFTALGMKRPPQKGEYLIGITTFGTKRLKLKGKELDAFFDEQSRAMARPWKAKDLPRIAAWLKANEKPLAVGHEAAKRDHFHIAIVVSTTDGKRGDLIGALLPSVQKCRELAALLAARAMLRAGEGKLDDAWRDLLACHRLGRLVQQGGTLIEALVGYAIEAIASRSTLAFIERGKPSGKQLARCLADLQKLPPPTDIAEKVDMLERCTLLDAVQHMHRDGVGYMETLADAPGRKPWPGELLLMRMVLNYPGMMREGNRWYDRMVQAMRKPTREERSKAFHAIDVDIRTMKAGVLGPFKGGAFAAAREVNKRIGHILICLLLPAVSKVQDAADRTRQTHDNLRLAIALEMYHRDNKAYPKALGNLAPKYLKAVPGDRFSGKGLIYQLRGLGYLLYSVGPNGKDDGGKGPDAGGDDIAVQMRLPAPKRQ